MGNSLSVSTGYCTPLTDEYGGDVGDVFICRIQPYLPEGYSVQYTGTHYYTVWYLFYNADTSYDGVINIKQHPDPPDFTEVYNMCRDTALAVWKEEGEEAEHFEFPDLDVAFRAIANYG